MTERRAWICPRCQKAWEANPHQTAVAREFQRPGEPEPKCPEHGKMVRQGNVEYRVKKGKL